MLIDIKFLHRMLHCNISIVNQCIMHASHDANTLIGYKFSFFRSKFGYNLYDLRPDTGLKKIFFKNVLFIDIITSKDWLLLL